MSATALHEKLTSASAHLGEYSGTATATDFGDIASEFQALLAGAGVYDLGWRAKIVLTGEDRVRWLNGMVTNNIRDLAAGRGVYTFLLNPQGHIQADLYAYNRGDSLLLDTDHAQLEKLLGIFDHYIIMDDVEVTNACEKLTAVGVAGRKAREILGKCGLDVSDLEPLQFQDVAWREVGLTLVRGDNPFVETYELWLAPDHVAWLWQALVDAGARPAGTSALELLRIASGIPRYGQDIRERDLPQETEQQRALHFSKGCYVGQEIVERIRSRGNVHRMFAAFAVEGALSALGTKIQHDGKDIGEITSAAALPFADGERSIALGYIRREFARPGQVFVAGESKIKLKE